jgi:hypothetical protein
LAWCTEVFLNLVIRKSNAEKTDENGNFIFEVEASNENLDLQGQVVLQRALLGSKDHFIDEGIISYDHLHKRRGQNGEVIWRSQYGLIPRSLLRLKTAV